MNFVTNSEQLRLVEGMLLKEMDPTGRIMVRSLDKVHARTGLTYAKISEIARRLQDITLRNAEPDRFTRAPYRD
jgi:hypothetical protein